MHENIKKCCRFCNSKTSPTSIGRCINNYWLYQCPACGSIGVCDEPAPDEVKKIYDDLFESGGYEPHRIEFELIKSGHVPYSPYTHLLLKWMELKIHGRKLLEIGGGTGAFGVFAKSRGWDYTNFDISDVAVCYARDLGLNANCFSAANPPPLCASEYDLVIMWEVIKYIYKVKEYLVKVYRALKPNGFFLFSTPNYYRSVYQKQYFGLLGSPPVHINFFTQDSLYFIIKVTGFKKYKIYKRRVYFPTNYSYKEIKKVTKLFFAKDECPTLYEIARKTQ